MTSEIRYLIKGPHHIVCCTITPNVIPLAHHDAQYHDAKSRINADKSAKIRINVEAAPTPGTEIKLIQFSSMAKGSKACLFPIIFLRVTTTKTRILDKASVTTPNQYRVFISRKDNGSVSCGWIAEEAGWIAGEALPIQSVSTGKLFSHLGPIKFFL